MGASASVGAGSSGTAIKSCLLKQLPDAIEESLYQEEKFPLLIDPTEQASRFLKYQLGSFIRYDDPQQMQPEYLNRALVGAFRFGRTLTLKCNSLRDIDRAKLFAHSSLFPESVLSRHEFCKEEVWQSVLTAEDPNKGDVTMSPEFVFAICTNDEFIPEDLKGIMCPIRVHDKPVAANGAGGGGEEGGGGESEDPVATMLGGKEIIRNSEQLVEAAFDGDLPEVIAWIEKGFHLESTDGRKHTALSEASCQGHMHVVEYLIREGADPNALSDNGRSSIWRAAFGGHAEVVKALLSAGADPSFRDKVSMESAFDVSQSELVKDILTQWPAEQTEALKAKRRLAVLAKIEERIKTSADREYYARQKIRQEIVGKATAGDVDGTRDILLMVAEEAAKTGCRPRVTAEVRNDDGLSLLAIAALSDDAALASMLLTHWRQCDKDRWDLSEGELSVEAATFKTNANSRDLKGWNCACIAVFHKSLKVLQLLCQHGANLSMRSMYNRNAYDLAKDERDAAENVVVDKSDIRAVIEEFDMFSNKTNRLFGTNSGSGGGVGGGEGGGAEGGEGVVVVLPKGAYDGVGKEGSPVLLQMEMNKSKEIKAKEGKAAKAAAAAGGGGGGGGKSSVKKGKK